MSILDLAWLVLKILMALGLVAVGIVALYVVGLLLVAIGLSVWLQLSRLFGHTITPASSEDDGGSE